VRKLTLKIMVSLFLVLFVTSFIPRLFIDLFSREIPNQDVIGSRVFAAGMIVTAFITLMLFTAAINYLIVIRVRDLNYATKKIAGGDYDIQLQVEGQDEISELTRSFNTMSNALKANEYLNKEFTKNFSHELKTPLSVIKGYAELMDPSMSSKEEIEEYRQIIVKEAERLSSLSKTMLQMSILDTTLIVSKDDVFNVTEQVREILQFMQVEYEEKNLSFAMDVEEISIQSNKDLSYQIWLNLVSNAVRFADSNTEISVAVKQKEETMHFSITNQGPSIPKEKQDKIFQLFYMVDEARHEQSTGVGLSLTKKIVEKLGGQISFVSEDGVTSFLVDLPIRS